MIDSMLLFAEDMALTTTSETEFTDYLDLSGGLGKDAFGTAKNPNYGIGHGMYLNIRVNTVAASTNTASTVTFRLKSCATTNGTYQQDWESKAYTQQELVAGFRIRTHVPSGMLRYVKCTGQAQSTLITGNFTASLDFGTEDNK